MHKDSQYEQHPDTICPHILPSTSVWEVQPTYPPPRGATDKGLKRGGSTLLPRASLRSYRERLCALTESVTALLPRAPLRSYNDRFGLSVKGDKPAPPSRSVKGARPTPRDNNHVKSCCLTNISLTLMQESDLLVSVSVTGTDIMIALAVAYTPTGCTGSR